MRKAINVLAVMNVLGAGMGGIYMGMTLEPEYYLTVIADEQTPLAAAPARTTGAYFSWTLAIMLLLAAIAVATWYIGKCMKYRSYYYTMLEREENSKIPDIGWNLSKLKRLTDEKENKLVERMIAQE